MSDQLVQAECVSPERWNLRRLALLAALAASTLLAMWWIDPRQLHVPLCGLYVTTGLYCPGCGATRATHDLLHGRLLSALSSNALWVLLIPAVLYGTASESLYFVRGRRLPGNPLGKPRFYVVVCAVAVLFGVLRNLPWEPFVHLAPPG